MDAEKKKSEIYALENLNLVLGEAATVLINMTYNSKEIPTPEFCVNFCRKAHLAMGAIYTTGLTDFYPDASYTLLVTMGEIHAQVNNIKGAASGHQKFLMRIATYVYRAQVNITGNLRILQGIGTKPEDWNLVQTATNYEKNYL